jgi:hypothetical protein
MSDRQHEPGASGCPRCRLYRRVALGLVALVAILAALEGLVGR